MCTQLGPRQVSFRLARLIVLAAGLAASLKADAISADLYWFNYDGYSEQVGDQFSLRRLRLDQSGALPETLLSLAGFAHNSVQPEYDALSVDGGHAYWRRFPDNALYQYEPLSGYGPASNTPDPYYIQIFGREIDQARENTYVPVAGEGQILRGDFEFENTTVFATTPRFEPNMSLALDETNGFLFWAGACSGCSLTIGRTSLDGSGTQIIGTPVYYDDFPATLAVDPVGGKLYFESVSDAAILRSNLDGTGIETVVSGGRAFSLAIDLHPVPEPATLVWLVVSAGLFVWRLYRGKIRQRGC